MTPQTFRKWLSERGCTFEQHGRDEEGLPAVKVRREGLRSELSDATSHKDLDPEEVRRVVDELGLDWRELPGPASRV